MNFLYIEKVGYLFGYDNQLNSLFWLCLNRMSTVTATRPLTNTSNKIVFIKTRDQFIVYSHDSVWLKGGLIMKWKTKEHWNSSLYYNKTGFAISCGILVFNVLLPFIESKLFTLIQCHNTTLVVLLLISLSHLREIDVGSKFSTYHIYPAVTGKAPDARSHPTNARLSPCKPCNV